MGRRWIGILARSLAACALPLAAGIAAGQSFVPPAGFGGQPGAALAPNPEPGAPRLDALEINAALSGRFHVVPGYARAAQAHVSVIGAYAISEPAGTHLQDSWGFGFLPVVLAFSDGRCFQLTASYEGGRLSGARLASAGCDAKHVNDEPGPDAPAGLSLKRGAASWGYTVWADPKSGRSLITAPVRKTFEPFLTADMTVTAIHAINGPDWPGGNVTLVGRIDGRLTLVMLDVSY
jgi:hypothetical protein